MTHLRTHTLTAALIAALCIAAGSATAQDALGTGSALDASPSTRGNLNTQRPSFAVELQFRNAIATGNAPGGLSFRGDLGYRAAGEFTAALGSDTLFSFRRDSLYSGLAGMGIRGTEALQYQFALTTGARPPRDLMGNLAVSREFGFRSSDTSMRSEPISINTEQRQLDPTGRSLSTIVPAHDDGSMLGTLRSSSSYISTAGMQPMLISVYAEGVEQIPYGVTASNLRGITSTPLYSNEFGLQSLVNAEQRDPETANKRPGFVQTSIAELAQEQIARSVEMTKQRAEGNPAEETPVAVDDWFSKRMQEIRDEINGRSSPKDPELTQDPEGEDTPELTDGVVIADPLDATGIAEQADAIAEQHESDQTQEQRDVLDLSDDLLSVLRGDSKPLNSFIGQDVSSADVYADHIRVGERLIASERYFDAEERFTRALAIRPGDPTSQVGRIHAQIGAGMVLSASVNLQAILTEFPQLASNRYAGKILPTPKRSAVLIEGLRIRAGVTTGEDNALQAGDQVRVASGLLLAYLGYQTLDADAVADGLGVLKEVGSVSDQRLARLLEQIWDVELELMGQETYGADTEE